MSRAGILRNSVLAFGLLTLTAWSEEAPPVPVVVTEVREEKFVDAIEALGTLRANEAVNLTANVAETVVEVAFEDGDRVRKGQVLVKMVSAEEEALLEEAEATATEAKRQFERASQLASSGASSVSELDEARRISQTARARYTAIASQVKDRVIVAPFDGVVGFRNISVGALVQPGDLITTLDDDRSMKLDFQVPSPFLPALVPGTPIVAETRAFPDREFEGTITSVGSRIDPVTRSVTVRASLPNPDRELKPGLLMTVRIRSNPRTTLVLPEESLLPRGRTNSVFVVDESKTPPIAERREVEIGSRRAGEVEILSGLTAGEKVVTRGAMNVAPGAPLRIIGRSSEDETLEELIGTTQASRP